MVKKKLKILVLIDAWFPFVGGGQIQVKNLKKILEKKYNCKYFIFHSPSSNIFIRFLWPLWFIPQIIILNKRYRFDLIHAHAYWPGIPGKILSLILKIPIVFTVHGSNLLDLDKKSILYFLEKIILTKIKYDWVISVSYNFLKYKNINKFITIIPNGVDVGLFDKIKTKKEKPFKILCIARRDFVKGLEILEKAMIRVKKQIPEANLKIISGGLSYKKIIKEYKSSHLFVLPSLSEGQPITLLEAWAAKLPVVVTAVGDNPLMVKNGKNGYLVRPKKINSLAKAIIRVLKDKKREILGNNGYLLVKNHFSWENCAQKTYQVYQKVLLKFKNESEKN